MRWQFWIDVGGTFTDCIARAPTGELIAQKVLSSGVIKGQVSESATGCELRDPLRAGDPENFWNGWTFSMRAHQDAAFPPVSSEAWESTVLSSSPDGTLLLADSMPAEAEGRTYELRSACPAPLTCIRLILGLPLAAPLPAVDVRLGTTRGTNALLERKGAHTVLITTHGFEDALLIGNQDRPRLFELEIRKPEPLFSAVCGVQERLDAAGNVLTPLQDAEVREQLLRLREAGVDSLAICLLHAYRNPQHEIRIESLAREIGFSEISRSSAVAPLIKYIPRAETTVLDAYLNPVLRTYVLELSRQLHPASSLKLMTSHGGLVEGAAFSGKDSLVSGPAGGVIAFSTLAHQAGFDESIGFDMGGTSTDVARFGGEYELEQETVKAGVRIAAPTLAIETVAAGGGSICTFDGVQLRVGPESAGAEPGPACYGRGGPLTVTDLNVALGRVLPDQFPFPLDVAAVNTRLAVLCAEIAASPFPQQYTPLELAQGFLDIANETMVRAIRKISIERGYDPAEHLLVSFGGAGGQHACAVARALGIRSILVHPFAGMLSAYGMGLADVRKRAEHSVLLQLTAETLGGLEQTFLEVEKSLTAEVAQAGVSAAEISLPSRALALRYQGVESSITVPVPEEFCQQLRNDDDTQSIYQKLSEQLRSAYETLHEQFYGYRQQERPLEVVSLHVEVVGRTAISAQNKSESGHPFTPADRSGHVQQHSTCAAGESPRTTRVWFQGAEWTTRVLLRTELQPASRIAGPAIICDPGATLWIEPGFMADIREHGEILLTLTCDEQSDAHISTTPEAHEQAARPREVKNGSEAFVDPVTLELFNNRFASIAEQMGVTLRRTAISTNVKERLDYSCAVFDSVGGLVANAPHIPVHLGAMGETVRCILRDNPDLSPGDVYVTNDPYAGGSHLPDVTVVTPVHDPQSGQLLFFTASRAHHAEIGGITPGSMPPFSRSLAEEGVLIRNFKLISAGESRFPALRRLLSGEPERTATASPDTSIVTAANIPRDIYPSRNPDDNIADIAAQVAANRQGAQLLLTLIERSSPSQVLAAMQAIQQAAALKMRRIIAQFPAGTMTCRDALDDGSPIVVTITIDGEQATIDFTGTGPVLPSNLNANRAIVTAAVMYVLRCLIDEPIPLNAGVLEPVTIVLPESLLNPPAHADPAQCAAMVGGNVETSQRVVDVLLGALGRAAASQGTMNNLTFGDGTFGYYETICGGAGATPFAAGADAVHTHMTNTRLTDVEILEHRYPVRIEEFSIRRGSGGVGQQRGGDGICRRFLFLAELRLSLLTQRRGPYPPFGLDGGAPGTCGRNLLQLPGASEIEDLGATASRPIPPGTRLILETPGGGGYGVFPPSVAASDRIS